MTGGWRRTARIASLPLGALALSATGMVRRAGGQDAEQVRRDLRARNTDRTRRVLGDLKGGALKAGQLLSTVESLFPHDPQDTWRQALTGLQEDNPGVSFDLLRPVLIGELGAGWRSAFRDLDETPVAAASIGRCTAAPGPTVAASPSRSSTPVCVRRSRPTCGRSPSPAAPPPW